MDTTTERTTDSAALLIASLALILSLVTALFTATENDDVESRLVCLEKQGVNDCGADGR